jgi:hypothetical protein
MEEKMGKVRIEIITDYDDEIMDSYVVNEGDVIRVTKTFLIKASDIWSCNCKKTYIETLENINLQIRQTKENAD